jgi:hypothetical protein
VVVRRRGDASIDSAAEWRLFEGFFVSGIRVSLICLCGAMEASILQATASAVFHTVKLLRAFLRQLSAARSMVPLDH